MHVIDVMTSDVAVCRAEDPATEAARVMWERDCGVVPVVDDASRVVGMVTDRDLCMAAYTRGLPLSGFTVGSVMTRTVVTCGPEEPLEAVESRMAREQVRRLPVTDGEGIVRGVVSINDIVRATARGTDGSDGEPVLRVLADIGEPRHEHWH